MTGVLERLWDRLAGPDPGPVQFDALVRRRSGNDALAAPFSFAGPQGEVEVPVYPVGALRLGAIVDQVALAEPGAVRLPSPEGRLRYRVRTRFLRFPDLVDVALLPREQRTSTLMLYSRSLTGRGDFGANRRRVEAWLRRVRGQVEAEERRSARR